jgi:hypothetical protein
MMFRHLPILLIGLARACWTEAETVDVEHRGAVDLKPFACQDITRSSIINRVCYDAANRSMIVQVNSRYFQHCDMPQAMLDSFLNAPSMGQYYKAKIASAEPKASYACPAHRAAKP